jgi:hypothetical protein
LKGLGALKNSKNKPGSARHLGIPNRTFRTSIANGSRVLEGIDGRTHVARRYGEVAGAIAVDLGGEDHLTELQKHLVRSVAGMVVLREDLDAKAINGEHVNTAVYCRLANSTRRVAATLGLSRVAKDITGPTLGEVLREGIRQDREAQDAELELEAD